VRVTTTRCWYRSHFSQRLIPNMPRVNRITIKVERYVEFSGVHSFEFEYVPQTPDDPFVAAVEEKVRKHCEAIQLKLAEGGAPADVGMLL
jgi:hypothetical protein